MKKKTSFSQQFSYALGLVLIIFLANYALNVILARMLSPVVYGDFAVAKNIILIASCIFLAGKNLALLKILPEYLEKKDLKKVHGYLKRDFKFLTVFGLAILITGILIPTILLPFLHQSFGVLEFLHPALYVIWIIPLFAFSTYLSNLLKSINQQFWSFISFPLLNPILLLLLFILLFFLLRAVDLYQVFYVYGFSLAVIITLQLFACHKHLPSGIFSTIPEFERSQWKKTSTRSFVSQFILLISFNAEIIILEAVGTNEANVGTFAAILTIASIYILLFHIVTHMITPFAEKILASNEPQEELKRLLRSSTILLFFLTIIITTLLYYFRLDLLQLFGQEYKAGMTSFLIVIAGYAISTILNLPWYFMEISGHRSELILPTGIMIVFNIISTTILIYFFDILGAAIGLAVSRIILAIWQNILLKRTTGIDPFFVI